MHPALTNLKRALERFYAVDRIIGNNGIEPTEREDIFGSGGRIFDHADEIEFQHMSDARGEFRVWWSLYLDRDGDWNYVSVQLMNESGYNLHVRYDVRRDIWEPFHEQPHKLPEAVQILGSKYPDDREIIEEQALEFISCMAGWFSRLPEGESRNT